MRFPFIPLAGLFALTDLSIFNLFLARINFSVLCVIIFYAIGLCWLKGIPRESYLVNVYFTMAECLTRAHRSD